MQEDYSSAIKRLSNLISGVGLAAIVGIVFLLNFIKFHALKTHISGNMEIR